MEIRWKFVSNSYNGQNLVVQGLNGVSTVLETQIFLRCCFAIHGFHSQSYLMAQVSS